MSKIFKVMLANGEECKFESIDRFGMEYPLMCSSSESYIGAEIDFHKMRILAEYYPTVRGYGNKIVSMYVNGNNINVHLQDEPTELQINDIIGIWSAGMKLGYCNVTQSNIFQ